MSYTILVVDDEAAIVESIASYLRQDGFQVVSAANGREALAVFRHEKPDVVILDVMMPELDGWETARMIRKESSVPLLFLTARVEEIDQLRGLDLGADEYLTKPFSPRMVVARVRALVRRAYGALQSEPTTFRVRTLVLDTEAHLVHLNGQRIDLTPSEFGLLKALLMRPGRVFTRMELLEYMQGDAFAAYERTVDVHMKNLRAKIDPDPHEPQFIETVYGVGYRMKPDHE